MKPIGIFLASEGGIEEIRDQIELFILRGIRDCRAFGLKNDVFVTRWETHSKAFHLTNKQDEYNRLITECEIFIAIFFRKANLTRVELEKAYQSLKQGNNPKIILVYFYEPLVSMASLNSAFTKVIKLKKWIKNQGQVFEVADSSTTLLFKVTKAVENALHGFVSVDNIVEPDKTVSLISDKAKDKSILQSQEETKNLILNQLQSLLTFHSSKVAKDRQVFGTVSPLDVAEIARLEFEIAKIKNGK